MHVHPLWLVVPRVVVANKIVAGREEVPAMRPQPHGVQQLLPCMRRTAQLPPVQRGHARLTPAAARHRQHTRAMEHRCQVGA